jgi:hypothetical protein
LQLPIQVKSAIQNSNYDLNPGWKYKIHLDLL